MSRNPRIDNRRSLHIISLHIDYGTLILLCTVTKRCVLFFECVNDYTIIKQQGCK